MSEEKKPIKRGAPRGVPRKKPISDTTENNPNIIESNIDNMPEETFYNDIGNDQSDMSNIQDAEIIQDIIGAGEQQDSGMNNSNDRPDESAAPFSDPLISENVETKSYEKGLGSDSMPAGDIPEPIFTRPKLIVDDTPPKQTTQIPKAEIVPPLNEEISGMSDAEKKAGAKLTVAAFWSGYEKLNLLMGNVLQIPVEKRIKMQSEGKLDLNMEVTVSVGGDRVTVNEFFEQYNRDVKDAFTVDQKLKDDLKEPMTREAMKRGLIMSDMQTILYRLGEDVVTKTVQLISIKSAVNSFQKAVMGEFARMKAETEFIAEQQRKESRLIDPESEEGQRYFHEMYNKIRNSELSNEQKAKAKSDLFKSQQATKQAKEEPRVESDNSGISEAIVISEETSNLDIEKEL